MRKSRLQPQQVLAATTVALGLAAMVPGSWARTLTDRPRYLLRAVLYPSEIALKSLADAVRRPADRSVDLGEGEQLRVNLEQALYYNEQLSQELAQARAKIAQLTGMREYLSLTGVRLMPASVASWSGDSLYPTLTINRGYKHGLRPGLVVADGFNLVGRLSSVGPVAATVRLVTAADTQLVVRVLPPVPGAPPRSVLTRAQAAQRRLEFWATTDEDDPVCEGDLAYLADEGWPAEARGLVVGQVARIEKHPDDPILRRRVVIRPIRSLTHLDRVTVIVPTDFEPPRAQGALQPSFSSAP
jgi:cell shape-determining protein MreC